MVPNFVSHRQKQFCFISKTDINQIHVARKRLYKFPSAVLCCSHNAWWGSKQKDPGQPRPQLTMLKKQWSNCFSSLCTHFCVFHSLSPFLFFTPPSLPPTSSHMRWYRGERRKKNRGWGGRLEDWLEAERRNGWVAHDTQKQPEMTLFTLIKEHLSKTSFPHRYMENNCFFS